MSILHKKQYRAGYVPRFQKTYLSREMTRALSMDHPIGDPHGGPAYGERNDPVSAIISIGSMFAATSGFTVGLASLSLAQGLVFAGAAMSLIGNVTGNKTLSKIGMVVGIAGGVGSLFDIGTTTTVGEAFGLNKAAPTSGAPAMPLGQSPNPAAGADVSGAIVDSGGVAVAPPNPAESIVASPLAGPSPGIDPAGATQGLVSSQVPVSASADSLVSTPLGPSNAGMSFDPSAPMAPSVAGTVAPTVPQAAGMSFDSFGNPVPAGSAAATMADPTGLAQAQLNVNAAAAKGPGFFDSLKTGNVGDALNAGWTGLKDMGKSWLELSKTNPAVALMMGQAVSSVADVFSGKADAQVDALEAQGQLSRAQAEKLRFEMEEYKRKIAQQNSNYANVANPLATWTPPAAQGSTPATGIIGGAMKPGG